LWIGLWVERNCWACRADLNCRMGRSRRRVGWCDTSQRLLRYGSTDVQQTAGSRVWQRDRIQSIRHERPRHIAQTLQKLAKKALGCVRVEAALHQDIKHVPVLVNDSPEGVQFASDADKHLV
jgi:hypothetical protein